MGSTSSAFFMPVTFSNHIAGYQVAKQIRKQPTLKDVVLVALTGYGQESDKQASMDAGFNHHLIKPARLAQVRQILANVARNR